jgi:hypothetical protein
MSTHVAQAIRQSLAVLGAELRNRAAQLVDAGQLKIAIDRT